MPTPPEISVIIPVLNGARTIGEQIEALIRDEIPFPWELLICDNGSTDGTTSVVEGYRNRIPGLRVIDASARRGPGAARNQGAMAARSPKLAFCDADDWVDRGWVAAARGALAEHEFVAGYYQYAHLVDRPSFAGVCYGPIVSPLLPNLPAASSANLAIRRDLYLELGGFEESLRTGEDADLCWRVQLAGHELFFAPQMRILSRRRTGARAAFRQGFSYGVGDRQIKWRYQLVARAYARQETPPESGAVPTQARSPKARRMLALVRKAFTRGVFRLFSTQGRADLAWLAHRPGRRLGQMIGRRATSLEQVRPPSGPLPHRRALQYDEALRSLAERSGTVEYRDPAVREAGRE